MSEPDARRDRDYPGTPDIEVLICTHNRADLLERALASLNRCERPADCRIAFFVVANACTDGTAAFLQRYVETRDEPSPEDPPARLPLRWIEDPVPGKSHALNLALPQSTGVVIAFVDDDHRVDAGYLKAICEASRAHPDADFFCGRILPDWDGSEPAWVHDEGPYRVYPLPVPRFELGTAPAFVEPGTATPGGGNLAIRRGLFERIGQFDLELGPHGHDLGGAEDIEWVRRGVAAGERLYYVPEMLQFHYVDTERLTLGYVMLKAYERSASTSRLSSKLSPHRRVPLYMVRKALTYAVQALFSLSQARRRFYLTRLAASLGEIKGFRLQKRARSAASARDERSESDDRHR
ncbi:MAG TPA: glycosyltransferase [Rhodocyclaceae bacterium]|nr:glycosyltransferase [Rhodocyclaceae bacterium]HRQ46758.1 glycosyltransferase [Rhodocyclaceae bacterium]